MFLSYFLDDEKKKEKREKRIRGLWIELDLSEGLLNSRVGNCNGFNNKKSMQIFR